MTHVTVCLPSERSVDRKRGLQIDEIDQYPAGIVGR